MMGMKTLQGRARVGRGSVWGSSRRMSMDAQLDSKMGLEDGFLKNFVSWAVLIDRDKEKQLDGNVVCKRGWE